MSIVYFIFILYLSIFILIKYFIKLNSVRLESLLASDWLGFSRIRISAGSHWIECSRIKISCQPWTASDSFGLKSLSASDETGFSRIEISAGFRMNWIQSHRKFYKLRIKLYLFQKSDGLKHVLFTPTLLNSHSRHSFSNLYGAFSKLFTLSIYVNTLYKSSFLSGPYVYRTSCITYHHLIN